MRNAQGACDRVKLWKLRVGGGPKSGGKKLVEILAAGLARTCRDIAVDTDMG